MTIRSSIKKMPTLMKLWVGIGIFFLICGLLPLFTHFTFHLGSVPLWGLSFLFIGLPVLSVSVPVYKSHRVKIAVHLFLSITLVILVGFCTLLYQHTLPQKDAEPSVVVILGHSAKDYKPSVMMAGRLDKAIDYLQEHPDAVCIVSGGVQKGTDYTIAQVMENYLLEKGIAPERIYKEDRSDNTLENLQFSSQIIAQHGLSSEIAIATDGFHQWRGQFYAKEAGLNAVLPLASKTPWEWIPCYTVREFFALLKAYLF